MPPRRSRDIVNTRNAGEVPSINGDGYISIRPLLAYLNVTRMTLWRWMHRDDAPFPCPIRVGETRVWLKSEIRAWEARKLAERDAA